MRRLLQLAAALLLIDHARARALSRSQASPKPAPENVEWIWQYTPDDTNKQGRENDLVQDDRFRPFLDQFLTAPQTFWGTPVNGKYRSLASTALDHLTVPGSVLADDNRYISISGCVVHFCPARGLLWIDLNGTHHLVVFAAIDWTKQGTPTSDPAAEYTLWVFPNQPAHHRRQRRAAPARRASSRPSPAGRPSRSPAPPSCRTSPTPSWSIPTARPTRSRPQPSASPHPQRSKSSTP